MATQKVNTALAHSYSGKMTQKNPFIFCMMDGRVVGEAKNFTEFKAQLKKVPLESVLHHCAREDFANWLAYIGKKGMADDVRKIKGNTGRVRTLIMTALTPSVAKKILHKVKKAATKKRKAAAKKKPVKKKATKKKATKKKPAKKKAAKKTTTKKKAVKKTPAKKKAVKKAKKKSKK